MIISISLSQSCIMHQNFNIKNDQLNRSDIYFRINHYDLDQVSALGC